MENIYGNPFWGGKREGAGRKAIGVTKKISLTLPGSTWEWLDEAIENEHARSRSELIREIIEEAKK